MWGDPAAAGLARRLRSPSPQPSGRAARAAPGRWRCTFRSVRRAMGLERRRAVGAPGRDPDLSPLPWNDGAAGAEERATLGRRVRPRWNGCSGVPAGGSRGGGAAIRPSRLARGRCSPGSLSSEAGAVGARQRGQRTVIGRRRAGGSGRGATGSAQPHWWSLGAGRRLRWRDAGLPRGSRTLLVFIPQTSIEPPHCVSHVAERSQDAGRRQLPPLSF